MKASVVVVVVVVVAVVAVVVFFDCFTCASTSFSFVYFQDATFNRNCVFLNMLEYR